MIKKCQLLIFLSFLLSIETNAQQGGFFKTYSGSDDISFFDLDTVHDGGYIVSGTLYGLTGGDIIVIKTDSLGNEKWRYTNNEFVNNTYDNKGLMVKETSDHCFIVTGTIQVSFSTNYYDIKVIKLDSIGNLIWKRSYDFSYNDQPFEIVTESDSTFYIFSRIDTSIFAIKFNLNGDTLFKKKIASYDCFNQIRKVYKDGSSFILAGISYSPLSFEYMNLIKLDSLCNRIWCKTYPDTLSMIFLWDVRKNAQGNYLISGTFKNSPYPWYLQILHLDTNGFLLGRKVFACACFGPLLNDTIIATFLPNNSLNQDSVFLGTFNFIDSSYNYYNGFLAASINYLTVLLDKQGSILSAGSVDDGNTSVGYLMKAKSPTTVSVAEVLKQLDYDVTVFFDALLKQVIFEFSDSFNGNNSSYNIDIIDTKGRVLKSIKNQNSKRNNVFIANLPQGMYLYTVKDKKQVKSLSGKFIAN